MQIDRGLIYSLLTEAGAVGRVLDENITHEFLRGEWSAAFKFVIDHYHSHRKLPEFATVENMVGVKLTQAQTEREPVTFWISEIQNRFIYEQIAAGLSTVAHHLEKKSGRKALEVMEQTVRGAYRGAGNGRRIESLLARRGNVLDQYMQAKQGLIGIATPWKALDDITQGWQREDFAVVAARAGVGKTFFMLLLAMAAIDEGKRVLFVSTEMSRDALCRRYIAMRLKVAYKHVRAGTLSADDEKFFVERVQAMDDDPRILIMGDSFDLSWASIETAIIESAPDMVMVDGGYLVKFPNVRDRMEQATLFADEMKKSAKRNKIPHIGSFQLNRATLKEKKEEIGLQNLGLSDNLGWVSDYVFFLSRDKNQQVKKMMKMKTVKAREGESPPDLLTNWDFDSMNFDQAAEQHEPRARDYREKAAGDDDREVARAGGGFYDGVPIQQPEPKEPDDDFDKVPF